MFCENSFSAKTINNRTSEHVDNYCVLDIETTGLFINTARIIEIAAIKVVNNKVVDEFSSLINPQCKIPEDATAVNHIDNNLVKNAPVLGDLIEDFLIFIGNDTIVGYNIANFDLNIINNRFKYWNGSSLINDYIDVLDPVKTYLKKELDNCRLETVSQYLGVDTFGNHRALKDCYMTKNCYDELFNRYGNNAFNVNITHNSKAPKFLPKYTNESLVLNKLHDIISDILEDGVISEDELLFMLDWKQQHIYLSDKFPYNKMYKALDDIIADGVITKSELNSLKLLFNYIINPSNQFSDCPCSIADKHICLTGEFNIGRSKLETLIEQSGGIVDKTVKLATNYVVIGSQGSDMWISGNYGRKVEKAMELIEKGKDIKIIKENDFIKYIN